MKIKKMLSVGLTVFMVVGCMIAGKNDCFAANSIGNTNGNIKKGGIIVKDNSGTYAVSRKESKIFKGKEIYNSNQYYIYKLSYDSKDNKIVANNAINYPSLNIKDNYLYYIGISKKGNTGIYKVKTDGSDMKRLTAIDITTKDKSHITETAIMVKSDSIYYINGGKKAQIDKISTSGTDKKVLTTLKKQANNMSVNGNYIYFNDVSNSYSSSNKGTEGVYRMKLDGTNKKLLYKGFSPEMQYYNGRVYYENSQGRLYRMNSNGTKKQLIMRPTATDFTVYNNRIYYKDLNNKIASVKLDGSGLELILKLGNYSFTVYDGKIIIPKGSSMKIVYL